MTDNEIVGEMIAWHKVALGQNPDENYVPWHEKNLNAWLAIEDVLAFHQPWDEPERCTCGSFTYPCEDRKAITNRMGGE